jgi:uncharacterized membrane protein
MIKKILIAVAVLIVVAIAAIVAMTFMAPTEFKVEREITINKPKSEVFAYAKILKNQNDWGPWFKKEPTMKQEFRGTDGTPGFVVYWKGEATDTGEGEQEIKKIVDGERIETELRFKQPFESIAQVHLTTEAAGENQTKVKWGFNSSMPRPMNIMLLFIDMDAAVGKDFGDGLTSMKQILEAKQP